MNSPIRAAIVSVSLMSLFACASGQGQQATPVTRSLYERLGGKPAIVKVVDAFVARVAADRRINGFFAHTDIPQLKQHLVDQICQASGGPCTYTGRTMKDTHRGMGISHAQFDALVEDLLGALDLFHVPAPEQKELLSLLGPMRPDIVEQS